MTEPPAEDPPLENSPPENSPPENPLPEAEPPPARREEAPPSPATAGSSLDASRILVRALAQLPAEDRDKVYTWLLGTSLRMQPGVMEPLGRQAPLGGGGRERVRHPAGLRHSRHRSGAGPVPRAVRVGSADGAGPVLRRPARPAAGLVQRARVLDGHRDPRAGGPVPGEPAARDRLTRDPPGQLS